MNESTTIGFAKIKDLKSTEAVFGAGEEVKEESLWQDVFDNMMIQATSEWSRTPNVCVYLYVYLKFYC